MWCSEKFSLVGTLAWHMVTYSVVLGGGGGGGNWSFIKSKNPCSTWGYNFFYSIEVMCYIPLCYSAVCITLPPNSPNKDSQLSCSRHIHAAKSGMYTQNPEKF